MCAVRYQRPTPYLWSDQDIRRVCEAARALHPPLKAASYESLFGLLAVTGMRLGEAIALEPDDVDLDNGVITIRKQPAKLERARLVPLHPTAVTVIALWLGHEHISTTNIHLHADMTHKQQAIDRTRPIAAKPGRYQPTDTLLASSTRSDYADISTPKDALSSPFSSTSA